MINNLDVSGTEVLDVTDRFVLGTDLAEFDPSSIEPSVDSSLVGPAVARPGLARRLGDRGMVTAEWAIGVVVAVSLAGLLLLFVVKGPAKELLTGIILKIINAVSAWGIKG